ncbi:uncharacterized protein LOC107001101 [Solanum pennellii]|uniref:Uncharacterized protein LOC107001101 n=1 Tax=Solanum pennellii TaxID=28526 RepID=A0ABM1FC85_SOLPN|nr:uncharacterized protein LOC107001101 [Solanum pennellii]
MAHGGSKPLACTKSGKIHSGVCREGSTDCFKCGQTGHFMRECPKNKQGGSNGGNIAQSSLVAPQDWVAPMGTTSGVGGRIIRLYDSHNRQEHENSPDVVTSMIQVFDFIVYALFDVGVSLYFGTTYVSVKFEIIREPLSEPFSGSTPVGKSILEERFYRDYPISFSYKSTRRGRL